jgi:hypothetical protein
MGNLLIYSAADNFCIWQSWPRSRCGQRRFEGLEASLDRAREIAFQEELDAVGHYIEEAQGYLAQIRVLHQEALDEFSRAQGE